MRATENPEPFQAAMGYVISVQGGRPPYTFQAMPSPPNPPGVAVTRTSTGATVTVPEDTPPGTRIEIEVRDSSNPPRAVLSDNQVA